MFREPSPQLVAPCLHPFLAMHLNLVDVQQLLQGKRRAILQQVQLRLSSDSQVGGEGATYIRIRPESLSAWLNRLTAVRPSLRGLRVFFQGNCFKTWCMSMPYYCEIPPCLLSSFQHGLREDTRIRLVLVLLVR